MLSVTDVQVWPWEIGICQEEPIWQWSCLLCSVDTLLVYAYSTSDRQMDASSKLTNIVDKSDPHHDCYNGCEVMCLFYVKTNFRNEIFLKNTQALD